MMIRLFLSCFPTFLRQTYPTGYILCGVVQLQRQKIIPTEIIILVLNINEPRLKFNLAPLNCMI